MGYSTTELLIKLDGIEHYLDDNGNIKDEFKFQINNSTFNIQNSKFPSKPEDKFETFLFLPVGEGRKGEGGLRTKGYLKSSYKLVNGEWYISDFYGEIRGKVPEDIREKIDNFLQTTNPQSPIEHLDHKQTNMSYKSNVESPDNYKSNSARCLTNHQSQITSNQSPITDLPLISVITVVFNGEKYLEQTIQSVINQTYPNVEYIIIDGGSTDGTLDIIRKYEHAIDYWVSEKDRGIYDAMNKGVRLSSGEWIGILGSDDFYEPNSLNDFMINSKDVDAMIVYGNSKVFKNNKLLYVRETNANIQKIKKDFIFFHPDSLVNRKVYKEIGLYDYTFKIAGDYDFFLRVYSKKFEFKKINSIVLNYRIGGASYDYKKVLQEHLVINKTHKIGVRFLINIYIKYMKSYIKMKFKFSEDSLILKIYRQLKGNKVFY